MACDSEQTTALEKSILFSVRRLGVVGMAAKCALVSN